MPGLVQVMEPALGMGPVRVMVLELGMELVLELVQELHKQPTIH